MTSAMAGRRCALGGAGRAGAARRDGSRGQALASERAGRRPETPWQADAPDGQSRKLQGAVAAVAVYLYNKDGGAGETNSGRGSVPARCRNRAAAATRPRKWRRVVPPPPPPNVRCRNRN